MHVNPFIIGGQGRSGTDLLRTLRWWLLLVRILRRSAK